MSFLPGFDILFTRNLFSTLHDQLEIVFEEFDEFFH